MIDGFQIGQMENEPNRAFHLLSHHTSSHSPSLELFKKFQIVCIFTFLSDENLV